MPPMNSLGVTPSRFRKLENGAITVKTLELTKPGRAPRAVSVDGKAVKFARAGDRVELEEAVLVKKELTEAYA